MKLKATPTLGNLAINLPSRLSNLIIEPDAINLLVDRLLPRTRHGIIHSPPPLITQRLSFDALIHSRELDTTRPASLIIVKWYQTRFIASLTTLSRCTARIRSFDVVHLGDKSVDRKLIFYHFADEISLVPSWKK